jgi:beta-glucanase (GH16 family)
VLVEIRRYSVYRNGRQRPERLFLVSAVVVALLTAATTCAASRNPAPVGGPAGAWSEAFSDDFDGGALDTSKWDPNRYGDAPFNPDEEAAFFHHPNVTVENGALVLTVQQESRRLHGIGYTYSSGVVQSERHFLMSPGSYAEARVKVPTCDGCWPAFWHAPPGTWPPEIDTFEFWDTAESTQSRPSFNYHWPSSRQLEPQQYGEPGVDYRDEFHVYGMHWTQDRVIPYLDGKPYPDAAATGGISGLAMGIVFNLSVLADHNPAPGSRMEVDWVRVWEP